MTTFSHNDYRIINKTRIFQGYFAIDEYELQHRLFDGGWSAQFKRELFERGHAVAVILYDPKRDEVILLEQFRVGALTSERTPWMIECVAGIVEPNETPEQVAIREVEEEAGVIIDTVELIGKFYTTPGGSSESISLYCARVNSEDVGGVHGLEYENEDIRVFSLAVNEVKERLNTGYFENATALLSMQWLVLNKERLQASWL
ncbi:MAG: NUDIX domain-containing protein [Gammaproteobacteria bacterium]|nr:NUDIX domain-containing protein [Gammaproteobacteria bacterium]NNJ71781.1 NUDIX domain-containing protein [Enterobacterales bacterium]